MGHLQGKIMKKGISSHITSEKVEIIFILLIASYFFYLQSVETPNGLIAHMFGPIEGRRHDAFMLAVSGLQEKLVHITKPNGEPYVLYGDPAYGSSQTVLAPFRGAA